MEICKRRVNMYDTVNQSKTPFITHVAPSTSTNLTMTFNNQLNTVHSQVRLKDMDILAQYAVWQPLKVSSCATRCKCVISVCYGLLHFHGRFAHIMVEEMQLEGNKTTDKSKILCDP